MSDEKKAVEEMEETENVTEEKESVSEEPSAEEVEPEVSDVEGDEDDEEEEIEMTEEERREYEREQRRIALLEEQVNKRCLVMSMCLSGALEVLVDCIENDLSTEKIREICIDYGSMGHIGGPGMAEYNKQALLASAAIMANKIFDTVVPPLKPRATK